MLVPIFDLDGTLLDSDRALVAAFAALGVPPETVTFGHVIGEECQRLGISLDDYAAAYDPALAAPYPGIDELLGALHRWAVCSNKHAGSARAELDRLGWSPSAAFFSEDFSGPKRLAPVLRALGLDPGGAIYIGDTGHDRACAAEAGVAYVVAGWNPRAERRRGDTVLFHPSELLKYLPILNEH
ncbi:MAG TPA: HAD-IA family hydrolase [Actinomycetota bacterium]|nr:HAD-IA family hydrolase [Actinomycetota bacterium]